jgi:1,4-dihydroxy-6-naphthoate synthase
MLPEYVTLHAQELEVPVMKQHIELYVNDFSYDMKEDGRKAVLGMLKVLGGSAIQAAEVFA